MSALSELAWPDVARLPHPDRLLVIPLGSTEQHGPHLPVATDTLVASALCAGLQAHRRDATLAPAVSYGASGEHAQFPGTLSIGQAALETLLIELVRSATDTFAKVVIVNGHGGNAEPLRRAIAVLTAEGRDVLAWAPAVDGGDPHAGRTETSLLLAIAPELVALDRAVPGDTRPLAALMPDPRAGRLQTITPTGVLGDPTGASATEGAALLGALTGQLCAAVAQRWPSVSNEAGVAGVALVTGAARGIGAATVRRLTMDGWRVVALDVCADSTSLRYPMGTRAELDALAVPGQVEVIAGDTTVPADLHAAVALAEERFGGLDAAVAVAGVIAGGVPLWEQPEAEVRTILEVDLYSALAVARAALPALLRRPQPRSGRVVAVASTAASRGLPMLAAYCAAKAGVTGLIRALALELRGTGITANAVSPGSTDTAILAESARLYGLPAAQSFADQQPIGRLIHPDEIAAAIAWLLSAAAGATTGIDLPVDGGLAL